ncbi:MAG: DUF503 domain-containing protein [Nitriliruptoraceae bacterium]
MGVEAEDGRLHFGAARIDLHLPGAQSLKDKRALLRRIDAALTDLGCAVAEVGAQDRWQRAVLGVVVAASVPSGVDRVFERLVAVIERDPRVVVLDVQEEIGDVGPAA